MVRALSLLLVTWCCVVCNALPVHQDNAAALLDDGAVRSERSTNLSHITGSLRKIQMYVKNWHLQLLPDGNVNGTQEDTTDYTILQRTTVHTGQVKIQGVATCQYLCMDSCGLLYATKDFNDECVFNETIEQHNYNTYSSARYSNSRRTMYLALNRRGQPRRVQVRAQQQLGKLSTYARVLTKWVSVEKVEALLHRLGTGSSHPLRHHGTSSHICSPTASSTTSPPDPASGDRLRCRKRKKRKKKRRRCDAGEPPGESCKPQLKKPLKPRKPVTAKRRKLCEKEPARKICQRLARKSDLVNNKNNKKKIKKQLNAKKNAKTMRNKSVKKVLTVFNSTSDEITVSLMPEEEEVSTTEFYSFSSASVEENENLDLFPTNTSPTDLSAEDSSPTDSSSADSSSADLSSADLSSTDSSVGDLSPGVETD